MRGFGQGKSRRHDPCGPTSRCSIIPHPLGPRRRRAPPDRAARRGGTRKCPEGPSAGPQWPSRHPQAAPRGRGAGPSWRGCSREADSRPIRGAQSEADNARFSFIAEAISLRDSSARDSSKARACSACRALAATQSGSGNFGQTRAQRIALRSNLLQLAAAAALPRPAMADRSASSAVMRSPNSRASRSKTLSCVARRVLVVGDRPVQPRTQPDRLRDLCIEVGPESGRLPAWPWRTAI